MAEDARMNMTMVGQDVSIDISCTDMQLTEMLWMLLNQYPEMRPMFAAALEEHDRDIATMKQN